MRLPKPARSIIIKFMNHLEKIKKNKIGLLLFLAYFAWVIFLFIHHEPWRDEVQSWLLVRDLDFPALLAQLKYEGHPIGWLGIVWVMAHLGLPYISQRIFCVLIVLAMACIVCFWTKNTLLKLLLLLGTPMFYELAVMSRNYSISALALLIMAICHADRFGRRRILYCVCLFFLMNANIYGTVIGIVLFGGDFLLLIIRRENRTRAALCAFIPYALTFALSAGLVWLVLYSNLLAPFSTIPAEAGSAYEMNNLRISLGKIADALSKAANVTILGSDVEEVYPLVITPLSNVTGLSASVLGNIWTALLTGVIFALIILAGLVTRRRRDRFWIIVTGFAGWIGTVAAISITGRAYIRHGVPFIFLLVYLWIVALQDRKEGVSPGAIRPKAPRYISGALAAVMLIGAFGLNIGRAAEDIERPYSMGSATAAFLRDNGYDEEDVLILAANQPYTSTILGLMEHQRTFRYINGDSSFSPWQVIYTFDESEEAVAEFIAIQLDDNREQYREILFIGVWRDSPIYDLYPVIYDSGNDCIFSEESYVVLRLV